MQVTIDFTWKYWKETTGNWELLRSWVAMKLVYHIPEELLKEYFDIVHTILLLHRKYSQGRKLSDTEKDVVREFHLPEKIDEQFLAAGMEFNQFERNFILACAAIVRTKKGAACLAHYAIKRRSQEAILGMTKRIFKGVEIPFEDYEAVSTPDDQ